MRGQGSERDVFRAELVRYLNLGCLRRSDYVLSAVHPALPYMRNARRMAEGFLVRAPGGAPGGGRVRVKVSVAPYAGRNPYVLRMMDFLARHCASDLLGAYVHGSLGTYEETAFSDFDALAIIKDEVIRNPVRLKSAALNLRLALGIMYEFDPLQHHGWFILTEADLAAYPEHYFPSVLFRHAKSLFAGAGAEFEISPALDCEALLANFRAMADAVIDTAHRGVYPKNMYLLKCLMSQFMLLPSLYVALRDGEGVFKKQSFRAARGDFPADQWRAMDEVSEIRARWGYPMTPVLRLIGHSPHPISRRAIRRLAPAIPPGIAALLKGGLYDRMGRLAASMREAVA